MLAPWPAATPSLSGAGYRPTLKVYGRSVTQSRRIAAFATDRDLSVKYSGTTVEMSYDYPPLLREIQDLVEARLGVKFNHVMLNHYENGRERLSPAPDLELPDSPACLATDSIWRPPEIYIGNHRDNRENRFAPLSYLDLESPLPQSGLSLSLLVSQRDRIPFARRPAHVHPYARQTPSAAAQRQHGPKRARA